MLRSLDEIYDAVFVPDYRAEVVMAWIESHQTLDRHPKTTDLRNEMSWDVDTAIGKLHRFWWWCVDYAPDGDLRKHNDTRIGDAVGLHGPDASRFVQAMVKSCWIDREPYFRVHDWWDYFGSFLKLKYKNKPEIWKAVRDAYGANDEESSITPPVTPPLRDGVSGLTIPNQTDQTKPTKPPVLTDESQVQALYDAYPKKVGRGQAVKAIRTALKKIAFTELLAAVQRYAKARKGEDPQFTPNPATWFNGERWLDKVETTKPDLVEKALRMHAAGQDMPHGNL